ncbi:MAG TPA: biotin/lipoyl-containing protein, partial [Candidatus Limnocylindria bacterium]|nr:biotin/lipoyl-containing protein [Candidatus Limnocylindria bacterium]
MPRPFVLPDLGEGLTEAEILSVFVREGDVIQEDTPLLEVETDKATVEIPSPMSGRVEKIHVQAHETVKVGAVLVTFADAEARPGTPAAAPPAPTRPRATEAPVSAPARAGGPVPAAPSTRRLARELGVSLGEIRATGPGGRVTDDDVRAA